MSNNRSYMNDPYGWIFSRAVLWEIGWRLVVLLACGGLLALYFL